MDVLERGDGGGDLHRIAAPAREPAPEHSPQRGQKAPRAAEHAERPEVVGAAERQRQLDPYSLLAHPLGRLAARHGDDADAALHSRLMSLVCSPSSGVGPASGGRSPSKRSGSATIFKS